MTGPPARPPPARALQPDRFSRIGPSRRNGQQRGAKAPRPQRQPDDGGGNRHDDRDPQTPAPRNTPRRDRAMRLVDRIDMAVAPIIGRLAHPADDRPSQDNAKNDGQPMPRRRNTRRHRTAQIGPHRRKPCDRFQQCQHGPRFGHAAISRGGVEVGRYTHKCKHSLTVYESASVNRSLRIASCPANRASDYTVKSGISYRCCGRLC